MADYGRGHERANYGEHPGAHSTEEAFAYAKTLLSLTMKEQAPRGQAPHHRQRHRKLQVPPGAT
eukprot:2414113-Heterocapsa_arctica.AAC.1